MGAGQYKDKFIWLDCTTSKESVYGQDKRTYTDVGELWCWVEEVGASEPDEYNAVMSRADVRIHVRQYPAVKAIDRLRSKTCGDTVIDNVR